MTTAIPAGRIAVCNRAPVRADGDYVLYWMIAARRTTWNFGLQHAVHRARELGKPLVVLEGLRSDYRWASDRLHRFVLQGMRDNAKRLERPGIVYYPYVEPQRGAGKGLLAALASRACHVVTDDFPCFFLPRMVEAAARTMPVRLEAVDSNGLLPLSETSQDFPTAYAFRRFLQKNLRPHLEAFPERDPLYRVRLAEACSIPRDVAQRWPQATPQLLAGGSLAAFPIDHAVPESATEGGAVAAARALDAFLPILPRYLDEHSEPEADVTSGLSPYLHFGHVAAHAVAHAVLEREDWTPRDVSSQASGKRQGWWGTSAATESFLDELVTWRELGYVFCRHRADYNQFESLPGWALATLAKHARDRRAYKYDHATFENARTHDPLWNAAQTQLVREGRIHNYLRMLWGKKILEWSPTPQAALETLVELNNRWALDGRNPNSYSGIFWVLGRFDRAWGPERPIYGTVRYMTSENTARKFHVADYVQRYAPVAL